MKTSHRVQSKKQPRWEAWQITAGGKKYPLNYSVSFTGGQP